MTDDELKQLQQDLDYARYYQKLITRDINHALTEVGYRVETTGNCWGIAATEYIVTKPDGTKIHVWSPPWNEYDDSEETMMAMLHVALGLVTK